MERVICNMASSITGMICDGGNQGCVMKGIAAVGVAYASVEMALKQVSVQPVHGINGRTPEDTMRYMGQIASPGMVGTEATIMDILQEKSWKGHPANDGDRQLSLTLSNQIYFSTRGRG